jgi:hypothetical protein
MELFYLPLLIFKEQVHEERGFWRRRFMSRHKSALQLLP